MMEKWQEINGEWVEMSLEEEEPILAENNQEAEWKQRIKEKGHQGWGRTQHKVALGAELALAAKKAKSEALAKAAAKAEQQAKLAREEEALAAAKKSAQSGWSQIGHNDHDQHLFNLSQKFAELQKVAKRKKKEADRAAAEANKAEEDRAVRRHKGKAGWIKTQNSFLVDNFVDTKWEHAKQASYDAQVAKRAAEVAFAAAQEAAAEAREAEKAAAQQLSLEQSKAKGRAQWSMTGQKLTLAAEITHAAKTAQAEAEARARAAEDLAAAAAIEAKARRQEKGKAAWHHAHERYERLAQEALLARQAEAVAKEEARQALQAEKREHAERERAEREGQLAAAARGLWGKSAKHALTLGVGAPPEPPGQGGSLRGALLVAAKQEAIRLAETAGALQAAADDATTQAQVAVQGAAWVHTRGKAGLGAKLSSAAKAAELATKETLRLANEAREIQEAADQVALLAQEAQKEADAALEAHEHAQQGTAIWGAMKSKIAFGATIAEAARNAEERKVNAERLARQATELQTAATKTAEEAREAEEASYAAAAILNAPEVLLTESGTDAMPEMHDGPVGVPGQIPGLFGMRPRLARMSAPTGNGERPVEGKPFPSFKLLRAVGRSRSPSPETDRGPAGHGATTERPDADPNMMHVKNPCCSFKALGLAPGTHRGFTRPDAPFRLDRASRARTPPLGVAAGAHSSFVRSASKEGAKSKFHARAQKDDTAEHAGTNARDKFLSKLTL